MKGNLETASLCGWKTAVYIPEGGKEKIPLLYILGGKNIKEELADVVNYCVLMADACGLDLYEIVQAKIEKNNEKYPVEKSKGKSDKYDKL